MEDLTTYPPETWLQGYFSNDTVPDECVRADSSIQKHWKRLLGNIEKLHPYELKNREQELLKLLEENGVTYNVYGDPDGLNRPWLLDVLPLVIADKEWQTIEKGMQQRAHVLDLMLNDLYGPQQLLKEGIIPAELIYAHTGFLRACYGIQQPHAHNLSLYAADLSRGPDGKIWVLRDRTQAPSGMGYALENRSALTRVLPELFEGHRVNKLGHFFNTMMLALQKIAPQAKDQPRIVLLTPGPKNETYFEHAFMASYLGLTLVQGEDMLVRNGYVWIKTVEGLEKVDVILRRLDDSYCDPLELREDSQLGVPGLVEVIRKGNVAVVNPLGSAILENTGLMAFMHAIFRYYIHEDPIFPMVATWWCGQEKELQYVLAHLDELVVKKIDRFTGSETVIGHRLTKDQKTQLIARIKAQPYLYVGQEALNLSTSPVFTRERLEPRYTVVRSFAVRIQDHYEVMPGGLTRCSPERGSLIVSNQEGGISKDTWVEGKQERRTQTPAHYADLRRQAILPSRAAENLFWVGRYTQRVVRTARFMRIVLRQLNQSGYFPTGTESDTLRALLNTASDLTGFYPETLLEEGNDAMVNRTIEIHKMICHPDVMGSITFTANSLLKAMYAVRDKWPIENWRVIDEIENLTRRLSVVSSENLRHVFSLLEQLNLGLNSFLEMNRQSMYRDSGWKTYYIGQLLEELQSQLMQYRTLLGTEYEENTEFQILEALLMSNQNLSNYRSVYKTYLGVAQTLDLLFLNRQNPTSLLFQFEQLLRYMEQLAQKNNPDNRDNRESKLLDDAFACYSKIRLLNIDKLAQAENGQRKALQAICSELIGGIDGLAASLSAVYFSHTPYQHQGWKDSSLIEGLNI